MSRGKFWSASRPPGSAHGHPVLVFDPQDQLHLPLTVFAKALAGQLSAGRGRTYLAALLPFFTYLALDEWQVRAGRRWDASPAVVRQAVEDYLGQRLGCTVRSHRLGFRVASPTAATRGTVRVFLAALKAFYRVQREHGGYPFPNPLLDTVADGLVEDEEPWEGDRHFPRMPDRSGVEEPRPARRLSDSYFKFADEGWVPHIVDDASLPAQVLAGGRRLPRWGLREECVTRLLFESGGRVSEVVGLTLDDWVGRGLLQEVRACSKGSRGRRVKFLRFSADTAKLLRRYVDRDRRALDPQRYALGDYLRLASARQVDLAAAPLFLSARRTPLRAKAYREHAWNPACRAAGIDADVHQARHWYVTMAVRQIYETAATEGEVGRRLRELIEYMHWRRGWETMAAYEHYFDAARHAEVQDGVFARLDAALQATLDERWRRGTARRRRAAGDNCSIHAPGAAPEDPDVAFLQRIGGAADGV